MITVMLLIMRSTMITMMMVMMMMVLYEDGDGKDVEDGIDDNV